MVLIPRGPIRHPPSSISSSMTGSFSGMCTLSQDYEWPRGNRPNLNPTMVSRQSSVVRRQSSASPHPFYSSIASLPITNRTDRARPFSKDALRRRFAPRPSPPLPSSTDRRNRNSARLAASLLSSTRWPRSPLPPPPATRPSVPPSQVRGSPTALRLSLCLSVFPLSHAHSVFSFLFWWTCSSSSHASQHATCMLQPPAAPGPAAKLKQRLPALQLACSHPPFPCTALYLTWLVCWKV